MSIAGDESVLRLIAAAKAGDLGRGDLTSQLLAHPQKPAEFQLVAKQTGVFAGTEIALPILHAYDPQLSLDWEKGVTDGQAFSAVPQTLATLRGPLASLLSAERVLLNFLQRLSGIATLTRRYVDAVKGTKVTILDTRKTTPGMRNLERYAVRCGGGVNHRSGLFDAVLIKDNHLAGVETPRLAAELFAMLNRLGANRAEPAFVEVEAQSFAQVAEMLKVVGIDIILLDNFEISGLREAVALRDAVGLRGKIALEASGGVNLETVRAIAETGVERISVGALTHSAPALDLSLERVAC